MKRTMAVLATIGLLALACGEGDGGSGSDIPTTNAGLVDPWNSLGLPVGTGTVIVADDTVAFLVYENADFAEMTTTWETAWTNQGFSQQDKFTETDFVAAIYTKAGNEYGWALGVDGTAVLVYLEDLSKVAPEESTVRQAKQGSRKLTRASRPKSSVRGSGGGSGGGRAGGGTGTLPRGGGTGGGSTGGGSTGGGGTTGGSGGSGGPGRLPK